MQFSRNIIIAITTIALLVAIPATIFLVRQQQNLQSRADVDSVTLSLSPATQNVAVNGEFDVDVRLNAGTHDVTGVDIFFIFDKTKLNVISATKLNTFNDLSSQFGNYIANANTSGNLRFVSTYVPDGPNVTHTGVLDIVRIKFKGITNGSSTVTYGTDSVITAAGQAGGLPTASNITGNYTVGTTTASSFPSFSPSPSASSKSFFPSFSPGGGGLCATNNDCEPGYACQPTGCPAGGSQPCDPYLACQPIASPSPSPSGIITTGPCTVSNVSWVTPNNATTVDRGTTVTMSAQASGNCAGKTANFRAFKANGALGPGCNVGAAGMGNIPFDSANKATATWLTPFPLPAQLCGPIIDGGPVQYGLGVIITGQVGEVLATINLKVREPIPNKVRVANSLDVGKCGSFLSDSTHIFNYPTSGTFTQIDSWNITADQGPAVSEFGEKVICAQFGYKPSDSTVTDWVSYPPIVVNTINYQAPRYSITGNVFNDTSRNGIKDAGEPAWVGRVSVSFPGVLFFDTDASGNYTIPNIPAGVYNVQVLGLGAPLASALNWAVIRIPQGYELTTPATFTLTLPPNGTANIGFVAAGSIPPSPSPSASVQPVVSPSPSASVSSCVIKPTGDADGIGGVDVIGDFITWRQEYLGLVNTRKADFDCDGAITVARDDIVGTTLLEIGDFLMWRRGYLNLP